MNNFSLLAELGRRDIWWASLKKLDPRTLFWQPLSFVVWVTALYATLLALRDGVAGHEQWLQHLFICFWLWCTLLFSNLAEAMAEGRGRATAESLRAGKAEAMANKLDAPRLDAKYKTISATRLQLGDYVLVRAGEMIPTDGEIVQGIATVNESAMTGESAPVIRESGSDRCAVTGGTFVVTDAIVVCVSSVVGGSFIDRMIRLVEGAERQKTPSERALNLLLLGLTLIFLVVCASLAVFTYKAGGQTSPIYFVALFVTLIQTTINGLLAPISIAGMSRLLQHNVIAKSGQAVEAAGDIDVLMLDKTGTITHGNRMASEFLPLPNISARELAETSLLCSLADDTPEGRSIVALAESQFGLTAAELQLAELTFVPFSASTRQSGVDYTGHSIRKGAPDAILHSLNLNKDTAPKELLAAIEQVGATGSTPLVVHHNGRLLGVICLKDVIKEGIRARFALLRQMGIRSIMVTGDNALTAATIAAEAGVDGFLAEATPEKKLELIRREQAQGRMVAMCGDGTNDAPALAQADVGMAMGSCTAAAREAGNMIDLDSNPTKLIEIVGVGKQLLMTRGALTTFSVANDVAKYFALLPAMFVGLYPQLTVLNIMQLNPATAILSSVIFNALIILLLIPLVFHGVRYQPKTAAALLRHNLIIYGLGGLLLPFIGIKLVDMALNLSVFAGLWQ